MSSEDLTYDEAGVDIDTADAAKLEMGRIMRSPDRRVLSKAGSFAALFEASFPGINQPVLVLKAEEPGSKQLLAFQRNSIRTICYDMINHLVNDVIVMGAKPEAVLDVILCGKLERQVVVETVKWISQACREQDCVLVGGETSEQPRVLPSGSYMLSATMVGVVDKDKIIDGTHIQAGDLILGLASNGVHTNGYSLVRALIDQKPGLVQQQVGEESFLEAILRPHKCYFQALRELLGQPWMHGLAHITGGGIGANLARVLPQRVTARINLSAIHVLPVFRAIRDAGNIPDAEMLRVFNVGVGMIAVVERGAGEMVRHHLSERGCESYVLGEVVRGDEAVEVEGVLDW